MSIIEQKNSRIRGLVNHSHITPFLSENRKKWHSITSSMDVMGDTQYAINHFFSLSSFNYTEGYLLIYGLLQAFYVQQDAVKTLYKALTGNDLKWNHYPNINQVRQLRNDATGHPTDRSGGTSHHFIVRTSISHESFDLLSYYEEESKFDTINLLDLKQKQEDDILKILNKIIKYMENKQNTHKDKFKGQKMFDIFPSDFSYLMERLVKANFYRDYSHVGMVKNDIKHLKNISDTVKKGIVARYNEIPQGSQNTIEQIEYIFTRIENFAEIDQLFQNKDAEVFIYALNSHFKNLKLMLIEIDEDFV